MIRKNSLIASVVVLCACGDASDSGWGGTITDSAGVVMVANPHNGNWTLLSEPEIGEELRIGTMEGAPEYQFGNVIAMDVDQEGRMYVLDQQAAEVRVYDADGRHLRSVGRPGNGPGELSRGTMAVLAGDDAVVYVADMMRQRIAAFTADGAEIGSTPLPIQAGLPVRWMPTPDRRFALQIRAMNLPGMRDTVPMRDRVLLRDPATERADTLLVLESGRTIDFSGGGMPRVRLFEAEPVWTVLQDGRIAHGRNDSFRIAIRARDGSLQRVITRATENRPVTEADRAVLLEMTRATIEQQLGGQSAAATTAVQQVLQNIQFADYYPAYAALIGGPGNTLWVQRVRTAEDVQREGGTFDAQAIGSSTWDVFDDQGRLNGAVELPPGFNPLRLEGDRIFGVLRGEMDVPYVVRLRVDGLTAQ